MNKIAVLISVFVFVFFSCSSIKKTQSQIEYDPVMQQDGMPGSESEVGESIELPDTAGKVAKVVFDSTKYHFGVVYEGDKVEREVFFTNIGDGDLLIELVTACECTQLDWSRLPIKKGQRSKISISYNSKGKDGPQIVDVDIIGNMDPIVAGTKFYITVLKKE